MVGMWMFIEVKRIYAYVLFLIIPIEAGLLIYLFSSINRRITYFFDAIRNEDNTLVFPHDINNRTVRELHRSLNRVNLIFATAHKESETNELFYRSLISHVRTGLIAFDQNGIIKEINPAIEKIFISYGFRKIEDFDKVDIRIADVLVKMQPGKPEVLILPIENEMRHLLFNKAVLHQGENTLSIVSVEDIKNELDHKELESWVKLIQVLNHEIANAVTPISTLSSTFYTLLNRKVNGPDREIDSEVISDATKALENIHEHAEGLKNFVNSYRSFTRLPEPSLQGIPLNNFIIKEISNLKNYPKSEDIEVKTEIIPEDLSIRADPELLQRVFSNILINALESMEESNQKELHISASHNYSNRTVIQIRDTGTGIMDSIKDQVFIPFFTTKEEGSGVGLSLSRQIMQLHKGEINLLSRAGEGTTVTLLF
jgi:nitrogen fixation/metabolism regulation signal transduction histidine kinase